MINLNNAHIFRSRGVILDLLSRRGYDVEPYKHFSFEDIASMMSIIREKNMKNVQTPLDMVCKHSEEDKYIHVRYNFSTKLKISNVEKTIEAMVKEEVFKTENDELIIIIDDKISNEVLFDNQLDGLYKKMEGKYFTQVFNLSKLVINIMEHELVPEHRIINEDEKRTLLLKFDISSLTQLPIILKTDPVAKFLGMKRGDVCEIKRPSETSGISTIYRFCQ